MEGEEGVCVFVCVCVPHRERVCESLSPLSERGSEGASESPNAGLGGALPYQGRFPVKRLARVGVLSVREISMVGRF